MSAYKIIRRQRNIIEDALFVLMVASLLGILTSVLLKVNLALAFSLLLLFICVILWIQFKQTGILKMYKLDGFLYLDTDKIEIRGASLRQNCIYPLSGNEITVHFRGRKGQWIGRNYCYGDMNEFHFTNDECTVSCQFLIDTDQQTEALRNLLRDWHKAGIRLKETGLGGRTSLMLETGHSYSELREKKEQLSK